MRVRDVMKNVPESCSPTADLGAVVEALSSHECGALPVTDANGRVVGIITDRDICLAVGKQDRRPSSLTAEHVMSRDVATCRSDDDIHSALQTMRARRVRRLPVVSLEGRLEGILCVSDLIVDARHANGNKPDLSYEDIMATLRGICWRHSSAAV